MDLRNRKPGSTEPHDTADPPSSGPSNGHAAHGNGPSGGGMKTDNAAARSPKKQESRRGVSLWLLSLVPLAAALALPLLRPDLLPPDFADSLEDFRAELADRVAFGSYHHLAVRDADSSFPTFTDADYDAPAADPGPDWMLRLRWRLSERVRGEGDPADDALLGNALVDGSLPDPETDPETDPLALLRLHARFSMDRALSTTRIPISSISPWAKALLSRDGTALPRALHRLLADDDAEGEGVPAGDTVAVWRLRSHANRLFLRLLMRVCLATEERLEACRRRAGAKDEFGMDLALRLWSDGNLAGARWAASALGARAGRDGWGRGPRNLTYARFVENSRKWAAEGSDCEVPVVKITSLHDRAGFAEVRRLMEENEPVLMRGVGYHLLGGPRVLGTDVGKLVEKVEKAMRAEAAGESVEEEEEEQDEDEEDEEREERERLRELENWDKRGPGSAGKEAKPPGVAVGSVPYAGYFALPTRRMGLLEYYRRHVAAEGTVPEAGDGVPYVFEKNPRVTRDGLSMVSQILELVFYREDRERDGMVCPVAGGRNGAGESVHFYLGRKGSGAPTHIHADAINFLVKGWKRWFVHPPLQSLYSRTPVPFYPSLLSEHYPTHPKPLECVQKPGDAFFVPFDWGHGVLNEADEVEARLNPKNAGTNFGYAVELVNRRSVGALPVPGGKKGRGGWGCE